MRVFSPSTSLAVTGEGLLADIGAPLRHSFKFPVSEFQETASDVLAQLETLKLATALRRSLDSKRTEPGSGTFFGYFDVIHAGGSWALAKARMQPR